MSAGATVVASRIGGLDSCIAAGHSGILVEPTDPTAWATTIEVLLDDPARARQLAAQGQGQAHDHTVKAHLAAVDRLIRRSRHPRAIRQTSKRSPNVT